MFLALGRGGIGSGRLRSEAYTADRLDAQLADIQSEFVNNTHMYRLDRLANTIAVTPIFSWREADFIAAYDKGDPAPGVVQRSPIERARSTRFSRSIISRFFSATAHAVAWPE